MTTSDRKGKEKNEGYHKGEAVMVFHRITSFPPIEYRKYLIFTSGLFEIFLALYKKSPLSARNGEEDICKSAVV
jgi:hypothetical protein